MELSREQRAALAAIAKDRARTPPPEPAPVKAVKPRPAPRRPVEKPRTPRQQTAVCPSWSQYDRHRRDGERCDVCAEFVRDRKHAAYAATPPAVRADRIARATARRAAKRSAALPAKLADMAARKAAVMAAFTVSDGAA